MNRLLLALILAVYLIILPGTSVLAYWTGPDSITIASGSVQVFRNNAETGDMTITFRYDIDYSSDNGSYPGTSARETVIIRLFDTDGTTVLAQTRPYNYGPFANNGYGKGVASFYFTADTSPDWGGAYHINILAAPAYFSPPVSATYDITTTDYNAAITQADAREALYNQVMTYCDDLKDSYPTISSLKSDTGSSTVLSLYGEPYFRAVIPGIQILSPQCFYVQVIVPTDIPVVPYTMASSMTDGVISGSDMERGATRIGASVGGLSSGAIFGIMFFILAIVICVICYRQNWGVEPALAICVLLGVASAVIIGGVFFTLTMIGGLVGGMGISYILLFRRA